jgi:hypothetical protein
MVVRASPSPVRTRLDFTARVLLAIVVISTFMFWQQHIALLKTNDITFTDFAKSFENNNFASQKGADVDFSVKDASRSKLSHQDLQLGKEHFAPSSPPIRYHSCTIANQTVSFPLVPQFIIAGAQKCGTSALMEFLNEHPNIQGSSALETHFFDWRVPSEIQRKEWLSERGWPSDLSRKDLVCALQKEYTDSFNVTSNKIFFEKTPSYLFLTKVPELISTTCFWKPKVVVILRNPIDRAISHFRMRLGTRGRSFEELIDEEVKSLKLVGLSHAPLRTDKYRPDDPGFAIPDLTKTQSEDLHWKHYRKMFHGNFLQRGMYITQMKHWLEYFSLDDGTHHEGKAPLLVLNYEKFRKEPNEVFSRLLKFVGAAPFVPAQGFNASINSHEYRGDQMLPETRKYLSALFRPYNDMLADTLGEDWRGVWD